MFSIHTKKTKPTFLKSFFSVTDQCGPQANPFKESSIFKFLPPLLFARGLARSDQSLNQSKGIANQLKSRKTNFDFSRSFHQRHGLPSVFDEMITVVVVFHLLSCIRYFYYFVQFIVCLFFAVFNQTGQCRGHYRATEG